MIKEKKQVIAKYVDKMNIDKVNQNLVMRAVQDTAPTKNCEDLLDSAYIFALFLETRALSPKRERQFSAHLIAACKMYSDEIQASIDRSR